jgi:hypothetical protein
VQAAAPPGTAPDRAFLIPSGVTATLQGLTIRHGRVTGDRPGGGLVNKGVLMLMDSVIRDNVAGHYSGGLHNEGTLTLAASTIRGNVSSYLGGGFLNFGTMRLTTSTIHGNAAMEGGGFFNWGTLTLTTSTIRGNTARALGGGLANYDTLTLTHSTISGNAARDRSGEARPGGGGLYNIGKLTLTQSTVSGNTAYYGGGVYNDYNAGEQPPSSLTLISSTITGNAATQGGGFYNHAHSRLTLTASLVADNPQGGDCQNFLASITSKGDNLDSDGSCQLTAATDRPSVDPLLGPLQKNRGSTLTHALLPGSPAINAVPWGTNGCGTILISDQRWQARPQPAGGACDIGAFEVEVPGQVLSAWVTGLTPQGAGCENGTTGQAVTLHDPASPWDCEAAGLVVSPGDQVVLRVQGPVQQGATDVRGAVAGVASSSGGCANRTTGQEVKFEALFQGMRGATAASCGAAGLVIRPGDQVQLHTRGVAE